jgi:hypothetical protein
MSTTPSSFIAGLYTNVLRRSVAAGTATNAELLGWDALVSTTLLTPAQVTSAIVNSFEATNVVAPIVRIYQTFFNRVPDSAGLDFWVGRFRSGTSLASISSSFATAPEFIAAYGTPSASTIDSFLSALYRNVLGRDADSGGFAFWKAQFTAAGSTPAAAAAIANSFAGSPEFVASSATNITNLFITAASTGSLGTGRLGGTSAGVTGTTFTLTTSPDNVVGTENNDTINATVDLTNTDTVGGATSIAAADQIAAGAGTDTLNITYSGAFATNTGIPAASISGVETINVRNVTGNALTGIDLSTISGVTALNSDRSTGAVTVTNLASGGSFGIIGNGTVTNGAFTGGYATGATAAILNVSNGVTAGAVTISNLATLTSMTINSTGAANTIGAVALANTTTALTVNASTNLTTGNITGFTGTAAAITVSGTATSVNLGTIENTTVRTINASGLTAGGLTATLNTNTALTVTGGAGNDTITTAADLGTGSVDAGAGTDRLIVSAASHVGTTTGAKYTNFEILRNTAGGASLDVSKVVGLTSIELGATGQGAINMSATQAAAVTALVDNATFTLALTDASGSADVLGLTLRNATAATAVDATAMTITGFETLNITSSSGTTGGASSAGNDIAFATAANIGTINVAGANDLTITTTNLTKAVTIASTQTGTANLNVTGAVIKGSSITTTANADTITTVATAVAGASGEFVTYNAGAGNDSITTTLTAVNNTNNALASLKIDGGAGTDTLTFAAADQSFVDAQFQNITNIENITLTTGTVALDFKTGGFFDNNFKTSGVTLTTGTVPDAVNFTVDASSFTGNFKLTGTASTNGSAAGEAITVTTGTGADDVTVTAASFVGAATSSNIAITTGAGADKIALTVGTIANANAAVISINGGTGADTVTVTKTNGTGAGSVMTFIVNDGDSTAAARDKYTGTRAADGTNRSDIFDLNGTPTIATATAGTNGTDVGTLKSHDITAGVLRFASVDTFAAGSVVTINAANLADALSYLTTNLATSGDAVVFSYDSDSNGVNDAAILFQKGTNSTAIELVGVTAGGTASGTVITAVVTASAVTAGQLMLS